MFDVCTDRLLWAILLMLWITYNMNFSCYYIQNGVTCSLWLLMSIAIQNSKEKCLLDGKGLKTQFDEHLRTLVVRDETYTMGRRAMRTIPSL